MTQTGLLTIVAALLFAVAFAAVYVRRKGNPFRHVRQIPWSIGIYGGPTPWQLAPLQGVDNPVLSAKDVTDISARFVADPFMIRDADTWYMFFEVLNGQRRSGEIACATSSDGLRWQYRQVVLAEPFHLSYPYVFRWEGSYYMVPESCRAKAIRLYTADEFPTRWRFVGNIMEDVEYVDSSLFRHAGKWWLLTTRSYPNSDSLYLFSADSLTGPWQEHPRSPVVQAQSTDSRPAGRILVTGERIIRYAQDLEGGYGLNVRAFEITRLDDTSYEERPLHDRHPVLGKTGYGWNGAGMHHVDAHETEAGQWLAVVDGRGEERLYGPAKWPWFRSSRIPG